MTPRKLYTASVGRYALRWKTPTTIRGDIMPPTPSVVKKPGSISGMSPGLRDLPVAAKSSINAGGLQCCVLIGSGLTVEEGICPDSPGQIPSLQQDAPKGSSGRVKGGIQGGAP